MKSISEINMNFKMSNRKADELDEIAASLRDIVNNGINNSMNKLAVAWKGDASKLYQEKAYRLSDKILKSAINFENIAKSIRAISKRTYDAEISAYELAQKRLYGQE